MEKSTTDPQIRRLVSLLGHIPGGHGAPVFSASTGNIPTLETLLDCLARDLANVQRMCEDYERDRTELANLRHDVAAMRRVLGVDDDEAGRASLVSATILLGIAGAFTAGLAPMIHQATAMLGGVS